MIKSLLLFVIISFPVFGSQNIPVGVSDKESFANLRIFQKIKKVNFLFEYTMANGLDDLDTSGFRLGGKVRLSQSFKLGAYYKRVNSLRHPDDWVNVNNQWKWNDTSNRNEDISLLELVYRTKLSNQLIFELKNFYEYNFFNDQQTYKIRPGLNYFIFKNGKPLFNVFTMFENYFALNFSDKLIYEQWAYIGTLYHPSQKFSVGPLAGWRKRTWTNSQQAKDRGVPAYETSFKSWFLGINLVFRNLF